MTPPIADDHVAPRTAFVVWVTRSAAGERGGIVERVRTGAKEPFRDLAALVEVITRMLEGQP